MNALLDTDEATATIKIKIQIRKICHANLLCLVSSFLRQPTIL